MKSIIELAIVTQLIDHRDTEESLPADFVQSLREFATAIRAQTLEEAAGVTGEFAQKWWSMHCASNKHMETTRKAHDDELQRAVIAEREACAKVCDDKAMHCEAKAQEAIEAGEHDEVSAIRSTAWQISVCAAAIRARGAA